jgi:1-acyl-sn-glycerol-3-phosphate acyltransferase
VSRLVYRATRALVLPVLAIWFRLERTGREHLPRSGPLILAANHRSVLDPIVVGLLLDRPVYYMAKQELFRTRLGAWLLSALGGFPVARGGGDQEAMEVADENLRRGDCLVIFPEGRCVPSGPLGPPRRGVGRLALASGAPVVPIAIHGTEPSATRRIPPRRVRIQAGPALRLVSADQRTPTPAAARLATECVWAAVSAEWEAARMRCDTRAGRPGRRARAVLRWVTSCLTG